MLHYEPQDLSVQEVHKLLLGGVAPRPIALVSTISKSEINNLSPFSFYNAFGANPPIIAFSPARRGRDAALKDTYNNLKETGECVVNAVTFDIVEQVSLASAEFPPEVDEFVKSGLTPIYSDIVKPKRVKESPFQLECKLRDLLSYGDKGASANIAICEVVKFHVEERVFENGIIHPNLVNLVARMSGDFYTRASGDSIFEIEKPNQKKVIGYDQLPDFVKQSKVFSANNLAQLANIESIPDTKEVSEFIADAKTWTIHNSEISEAALEMSFQNKDYKRMLTIILLLGDNSVLMKSKLEKCAKLALDNGDKDFAWKVILYSNSL